MIENVLPWKFYWSSVSSCVRWLGAGRTQRGNQVTAKIKARRRESKTRETSGSPLISPGVAERERSVTRRTKETINRQDTSARLGPRPQDCEPRFICLMKRNE